MTKFDGHPTVKLLRELQNSHNPISSPCRQLLLKRDRNPCSIFKISSDCGIAQEKV